MGFASQIVRQTHKLDSLKWSLGVLGVASRVVHSQPVVAALPLLLPSLCVIHECVAGATLTVAGREGRSSGTSLRFLRKLGCDVCVHSNLLCGVETLHFWRVDPRPLCLSVGV